jgi:transcriptional regulator with XRE-family HTH domain
MSEVEHYIRQRKARNPTAWEGFEKKYTEQAIGLLLAEYREKSGLSLSEFARRSHIAKSALSRLENHGEDVRLSTIARYVETVGAPLHLTLYPSAPASPRPATKLRLRLKAV